jgi:hypothetical protein
MKWTQEEAIAFECAREVITDMMAICSADIDEEECKHSPDLERLALLETELARLADERAALTVSDQDEVARVRKEYGAKVRQRRQQRQTQGIESK